MILVKEKKRKTRKCESFRRQPADLPPCYVFRFACAAYSEYASKDISLLLFCCFMPTRPCVKPFQIELLTLFFRRRWVITVAFKKNPTKTSESRQSQLCAYITRSPVHGLLSCQNLVQSLSLFQKCRRAPCACLRAAILLRVENDLRGALGLMGRTNILKCLGGGEIVLILLFAGF